MPAYDFICDGGHKTEVRQVGVDLQAILCPECGKTARRVAVYASQHIRGETVARGGRGRSQNAPKAANAG